MLVCRYDRHFAPNVSLAPQSTQKDDDELEPGEVVRKDDYSRLAAAALLSPVKVDPWHDTDTDTDESSHKSSSGLYVFRCACFHVLEEKDGGSFLY